MLPAGVSTESNATLPTTVIAMNLLFDVQITDFLSKGRRLCVFQYESFEFFFKL